MKGIYKYILVAIVILSGTFVSCKKFLDIVPDNVPVLSHAFASRVMAERYLATCYSFIPAFSNSSSNPALMGADELWQNPLLSSSGWNIARGQQTSSSPILTKWDDNNSYWVGIAQCNTFIDSIGVVPDMPDEEKAMWRAEAMFLKAFYHYQLLRMYGPIPISDKSIPVYQQGSEVFTARKHADSVFNYIVKTIDLAMPDLMPDVTNINQETGRVTQLVAKAMKAEILVWAASPLFNGNMGLSAGITNKDGTPLFNQVYSAEKWEKAAVACKEAIDDALSKGKALHVWQKPGTVTSAEPSTVYQMSIREAFNENDNNNEAIWLYTNSLAGTSYQMDYMPRGMDANQGSNANIHGNLSATLNMAEKFYSENGIPINEDKTFPYGDRFEVVKVTDQKYRFNLSLGTAQDPLRTIRLHLDREPRFYGSLAIDGGRFFMMSNGTDASAFSTFFRTGGNVGPNSPTYFNYTGYAVKKQVNYRNTFGSSNSMSIRSYAPPLMRLANLYLLYAEALNELNGPVAEAFSYIDKVRERVGLMGVVQSWQQYSLLPNKPTTKEGLREIIKAERTNELAFEGQRFWDLRRWKDATMVLNQNVQGFDVFQTSVDLFYRPKLLFSQTFDERDYFWPISIAELRKNQNLVQNYGW